jgi:benzoyl-CoA reductase/2-hydroxyglutaryl-CoA dehydratase subunit BcrC/BadD/HgdB
MMSGTQKAVQKESSQGRVPIEAAANMKAILQDYFESLQAASIDPERKVAWLSSVGPAELVRSFGFEVYFPENHAALLGATRKAAHYIPRAVAQGYSPEICAYLTSDIGAHLAHETALTAAYGLPDLPKPDVLVYSTNQCRDVGDWWHHYGRHYGVPVLGVHPPHMLDSVEQYHVDAVRGEYHKVALELRNISGRELDAIELKEIVSLSQRASQLWREILELAASRPSPFTFFDGVIHMAPIVLMRGTKTAVSYYELLKEEVTARVKNKVAAVPGERLRLYWEGMPIWGALRELSSLFFQLKSAVVASTYCNSWAFDRLDPSNAEESMARVYTEIFINRSEEAKLSMLKDFLQLYQIDGVIFHDCKTCPNNTNCRYGMPERIYEELGIPTVTIGGDMVDLRMYSPDQVRTTIEGFVEQLRGF